MEALADTLAVTHLRKRCKTSGHQLIYLKEKKILNSKRAKGDNHHKALTWRG